MKIKKFNEYTNINENKMWYKSISEFLNWLENKSKMPFLLLDTETTGLKGPNQEQLTQISCVSFNYNYSTNSFNKIDDFDEKIKLTDDTKSKFNKKGDDTKFKLKFNKYGSGNYKYKNEKEVIDSFFNYISEYSPCLLIAQNAPFDMQMLGGRYKDKIKEEVFDTKMLSQLYFLPLIQKLAETDNYYKNMVDNIGTSQRDNGLISSSMSKIGPALEIDMKGYHDALTDCFLMKEMMRKVVDILKDNKHIDISKYQIERIKTLR